MFGKAAAAEVMNNNNAYDSRAEGGEVCAPTSPPFFLPFGMCGSLPDIRGRNGLSMKWLYTWFGQLA